MSSEEFTRRCLCSQEQNSCPSALRPTSLNRSPGPLASPNSAEIVVFTDNRSDAASILEFAGLLVEVLIVDYQRQRARHGQEAGAQIARRLAGLGARVEVQCLSSEGKDVGHLLLSQAVEFRADLLIMGAYGHSKLREWMFGGVTRTVLYEAGLPVLMSR